MARALMLMILFHGSVSAQDLVRGWAWAGIAAASLDHQGNPGPVPVPKPGDTCKLCNGSGKVGDGVISQICKDCKGTGKVLATAVSALQQKASDLLLEPAIRSNPATVQSCPGGVCNLPSKPAKTYTPPQPATLRRGWIFRR